MVHHIALRTRKLVQLERFYRAALGLRVRRRSERSVWLAAGSTILMLEAASPTEPRIPRKTMELLCFVARTRSEQSKLRRRIARLARIEAETDYTFYFRDPDGRRLGVSCYRFV